MCTRARFRQRSAWHRIAAAGLVTACGALAAGQQPKAPVAASAAVPAKSAAATGMDAAVLNENAQILLLAKELKAEVDKTNKDILSLKVVRKAQEIEQLTKNAEHEMKAALAAN